MSKTHENVKKGFEKIAKKAKKNDKAINSTIQMIESSSNQVLANITRIHAKLNSHSEKKPFKGDKAWNSFVFNEMSYYHFLIVLLVLISLLNDGISGLAKAILICSVMLLVLVENHLLKLFAAGNFEFCGKFLANKIEFLGLVFFRGFTFVILGLWWYQHLFPTKNNSRNIDTGLIGALPESSVNSSFSSNSSFCSNSSNNSERLQLMKDVCASVNKKMSHLGLNEVDQRPRNGYKPSRKTL